MKYNIDYFTKKFSTVPKQLDYVALGSTQAHFMYDFNSVGVAGFNMAIFKDTYHYQELLTKYEENINKGAVILINLSYPSFICDINEGYSDIEKYQSSVLLYGIDWKLSKDQQEMFISNPYNYIKESLFNGFIRNSERNRNNNIMSKEEIIKYGSFIITSGWEPETGIHNIRDYQHRDKTETVQKRIIDNIEYLTEVIRFIRFKKWIPVLIGAPYSGDFNALISEDFIKDYFYDSMEKLKKKEKLDFIDYSMNEDFQDINLYLDVWNLNDTGRILFTKSVLNDLKKDLWRREYEDSFMET